MELSLLQHPQFGGVRTTYDESGTVLFCGNDVAKALGYARPRDAISSYTKGAVKHRLPTNGGNQDFYFIYEPDLYRLVAKSRLPLAEEFERWVLCSAEHKTHYAQSVIMHKIKSKSQNSSV